VGPFSWKRSFTITGVSEATNESCTLARTNTHTHTHTHTHTEHASTRARAPRAHTRTHMHIYEHTATPSPPLHQNNNNNNPSNLHDFSMHTTRLHEAVSSWHRQTKEMHLPVDCRTTQQNAVQIKMKPTTIVRSFSKPACCQVCYA
jgi:hypothetical protein